MTIFLQNFALQATKLCTKICILILCEYALILLEVFTLRNRNINTKHNYDNVDFSENQSFVCTNCGKTVSYRGAGSKHRNHCPHCLSSLHLDNIPGDRSADCGGIMEAIGVWVRKDGEWALIHRCKKCGRLSSNRIAADDNPVKLLSMALKPLALPPFPLDRIEDIMIDFSLTDEK